MRLAEDLLDVSRVTEHPVTAIRGIGPANPVLGRLEATEPFHRFPGTLGHQVVSFANHLLHLERFGEQHSTKVRTTDAAVKGVTKSYVVLALRYFVPGLTRTSLLISGGWSPRQ